MEKHNSKFSQFMTHKVSLITVGNGYGWVWNFNKTRELVSIKFMEGLTTKHYFQL